MISTPSGSFDVTMLSDASWSMRSQASTSRPSTLPAIVAFASPGPIDAATSCTLGALSNDLVLPSGSVIWIMMDAPAPVLGRVSDEDERPGAGGRDARGRRDA